MDYFMAALELTWGPSDEDEVENVLGNVQDLFNASFGLDGMAMSFISVAPWSRGGPIATALVIDLEGTAEKSLDEALFSVISALELDEDLLILDREEREDRVTDD